MGSAEYQRQQGVTAGVTGQLTRIAVYVENNESAGEPAATRISVTLGAPWQPGAQAWTTVTLLEVGWNTFNLASAKILVGAGEVFTISIHGQSQQHHFNPGFGFSRADDGDPDRGDQYAGGELFLNGITVGSERNDLLFRTYVKP